MRRTTLARWLVVGALAGFGVFVGANIASAQEASPSATPSSTPAPAAATPAPQAAPSSSSNADPTVQGSNSSRNSTATSSTANARNNATVGAGPSASNRGQSSQIGDNDVTVNQQATARSGDAVAGSQIVGVVGGGDTTIQEQNDSRNATARSGDATATNNLTVIAGPQARTNGGRASAQQIGDNSVSVDQDAISVTGDAVAGSQVTGVVGDGGDNTVQNSNTSTNANARSGNATARNTATVNAGPFARSNGGNAQAAQIGDNDESLSQSSTAHSGDAVAGSQVTGAVDDATVQNQNDSTRPTARSGVATATNVATLTSGPQARTTNGGARAQASQNGDNTVDVDQTTHATSGDAIAGSQVTGMVSEEWGHLTVQNQQSSDRPTATTGAATARSTATVNAGPLARSPSRLAQASQIGDNDVTVDQTTKATTGDALAGAQVTGAIGGDATVQGQNDSRRADARTGTANANSTATVQAGPVALPGAAGGRASASQIGDNTVDLSQDTSAHSGDAVAGGQVVGIVSDGDATVQLQNSSNNDVARSGDATARNTSTVNAGPFARATGTGHATATQNGDNHVRVDQTADATSGDAVAGGQVVGVVGGEDVTVQASNDSTRDTARTGNATARNTGNVQAGPLARTTGSGPASVSQVGDNRARLDQDASATSGDAVSGSQVVGIAGGDGKVTVQLDNTSRRNTARTGTANARNNANLTSGPVARATGTGHVTVSQIGDNRADVSQTADSQSGDAVSGSQVVGVASDSDTTVQHSNDSVSDTATTATANSNNTATGGAGPVGTSSTTSHVSQNGDNDADLDQLVKAVTGDSVAGSAVIGIV